MGEWEGQEDWRARAWSHSASSYLALCLPESTDVPSDGSALWVHCVETTESKKASSHRKRGLPAGLSYVRCGDKLAWFIQTKGFSSPIRSVPETHTRGHIQE